MTEPAETPAQVTAQIAAQVTAQLMAQLTQTMEQAVHLMVLEAPFKQVLKEWSRHVKLKESPTTFASLYMEIMRDPMDHEGRKNCAMFASFIKVRSWETVLTTLTPKLDPDVLESFQTPFAAEFYEGFKAMVIDQIRAYWEAFVSALKEKKALMPGPKDWSPIGVYKLK